MLNRECDMFCSDALVVASFTWLEMAGLDHRQIPLRLHDAIPTDIDRAATGDLQLCPPSSHDIGVISGNACTRFACEKRNSKRRARATLVC